MPLLPLTGVHHKHPINFSQDITSYTAKGREKIHKSVQCVETQELRDVMKYRNLMKALNLMIIVFLHILCNRETAMSWEID